MSRLDSFCRYCHPTIPDPDLYACGFCLHVLFREITDHLTRAARKASQS